jgi:hypothetical protein
VDARGKRRGSSVARQVVPEPALLAARFPKPDVRDAIRRLPTRSEVRTPDGGGSVDAAPLAAPAGSSNCSQVGSEPGEGQHALQAVPKPRASAMDQTPIRQDLGDLGGCPIRHVVRDAEGYAAR